MSADIVLIKLQPNQDLVAGLEAACLAVGIRRACILSGVGSLNDAYLEYAAPDGTDHLLVVTGPGLEVAGVAGEVQILDNGEGASTLSAWVCDQSGAIAGGRLQRDRNIVCITFEFVLQPWAGPAALAA